MQIFCSLTEPQVLSHGKTNVTRTGLEILETVGDLVKISIKKFYFYIFGSLCLYKFISALPWTGPESDLSIVDSCIFLVLGLLSAKIELIVATSCFLIHFCRVWQHQD